MLFKGAWFCSPRSMALAPFSWELASSSLFLKNITFSGTPLLIFYISYNSCSPILSFLFHQKYNSPNYFSLYSFLYKPSFAPFAHLVKHQSFGFHFPWWVSFLFFLFLEISVSFDLKITLTLFYHEYFEDDDDYCHILSNQLPLVVNFTYASFVPNNQTNIQPSYPALIGSSMR